MPEGKLDNSPPNAFQGLNDSIVLEKASRPLNSDKCRSSWRRTAIELKRAGVGGVDTYLRASFSELAQKIRERLSDVREGLGKAKRPGIVLRRAICFGGEGLGRRGRLKLPLFSGAST